LSDLALPPPAKRSKLAIAAAVVAFLLAAANLLLAVHSPIAAVAGSILPLLAGIGIVRKRVWAAYGYAMLALGQALVALLLLRDQNAPTAELDVTGVFALALSLLFFLAGRALAHSGATRGHALPWMIVACLVTFPFLFVRAFVIPTGSMENTLLIGDHVFVRVFPRPNPARRDLLVYRYPPDPKTTSIKRVIGVPGDRLRMVAQTVFVNSAALREPYVVHRFPPDDPYRDNFPSDPTEIERILPSPEALAGAKDMFFHHVVNGEVVVPPGKYFVMGDNRDNSLDSRYWGFIDATDIIGKPILIYASQETHVNTTAFSLPHVRWNRLFKLL